MGWLRTIRLCALGLLACTLPLLSPAQAQKTQWRWVEDASVLNPSGIDERDLLSLCFVDLDRDGDQDLVLRRGQRYRASHLEFYQNQGSPCQPQWVQIDGFFATMQEVPSADGIAFADLDGDGYPNPITSFYPSADTILLAYWRNQGTLTEPNWQMDPDVFSGVTLDYMWPTQNPSFADMDGDGDLDFIVGWGGYSDKGLRFFENIGDAFNPVWREDSSTVAEIHYGYTWGSPQLLDFNGDGYMDLLLITIIEDLASVVTYEGRRDSLGYHWRFNWELTRELDFYPGDLIEIRATDLDGDGDQDLVTLSSSRGIRLYENKGDGSHLVFNGNYTRLGGIKVPKRGVPLLFDYDADGDLDLLVNGNAWGWAVGYTSLFEAYRNVSSFSKSNWLENQWINHELYPHSVIQCRTSLVDLNGDQKPGYYQVVWDGKDSNGFEAASGVYIYVLEAKEEGFRDSKKLLLLR